MKVCPFCGSTRYKSLLDSRTPRCCYKREKAKLDFSRWDLSRQEYDERLESIKREFSVSTVKGQWYKRAPIYRVLDAFTKAMQQSEQQGRYFKLLPTEHKVIVPAVKTLLDRCGWDEDLALEFMAVRFKKWYSHKPCESFFQIISPSNFSVHLSKARRNLKRRAKKDNVQKECIEHASEQQTKGRVDRVYAIAGMDVM